MLTRYWLSKRLWRSIRMDKEITLDSGLGAEATFWYDIEVRLWKIIADIDSNYYSQPNLVNNFKGELIQANKLLSRIEQVPPPFNSE